MTTTRTARHASATAISASRRARVRRRTWIVAGLTLAVVLVVVASLMVGQPFFGLDTVARVVAGESVPGADFIVGRLRLPRALLGVLVGVSFGMAGVTFQTMLRNPLASPDIIGITSGATASAVAGIVLFSLSGTQVSLLALGGAILTALAIYALSIRGGFKGTRLILIGIGIAAFLNAMTAYLLSRAVEWDLQNAMRWITGSLNTSTWDAVRPVALVCAVVVPLLVLKARDLDVLRLGDDAAAALGVRVGATRVVMILAAVVLLAVATAAAGPVAFVAFMAGPIASRILGPGGSLLLPAALVGALLVLLADLVGQFAFDHRYPVGVVTGVLGAPFLLYLLIKSNRSGGSL